MVRHAAAALGGGQGAFGRFLRDQLDELRAEPPLAFSGSAPARPRAPSPVAPLGGLDGPRDGARPVALECARRTSKPHAFVPRRPGSSRGPVRARKNGSAAMMKRDEMVSR